ncbi:MAG: class I adenylate-forming enzyme family protein [Alphaproteobacteria bacterium]
MSSRVIGDILRGTAARAPERIAIIDGAIRMRYRELDGAADRLANALLAHDLGHGHTVAILAPNQADYAVFYFGAARAGCLQAHLPVRFTKDDLARVIAGSGIEAVFVDPEYLPVLNEARVDLPGLRYVVCIGDSEAGPMDQAISLEGFLAGADETPCPASIEPEEAFCITYTGGTTGLPKGVLATHAARVMSSEMAWPVFRLSEEDIVFLASPLFHVAGLFSWFSTGIYGGCTFVLMRYWQAGRFIDLAAREKITAACMVPTQINGFVSDPGFSTEKLKTLRYINYGGSPMPDALLDRVQKHFPGIVMFEHYGQSEIGPACYRAPERAHDKVGSVGVPFAELQLKIVDTDGATVPRGEVGEVLVKAGYLFKEYYRDPEQTAAAFTRDGWLKTGDLGYRDEEGFLYLVDRAKDMIISGAENIYPAEIENALYAHEAVAEAAVFGIPDEHWGEVPAAHIVLKPGANAEAKEIEDFVADKIARHKRPRLVAFVDDLPKTSIGKVRKNILREPYWKARERKI